MDVDGKEVEEGAEIMHRAERGHIRGPYIIHSGKSISGEYSGVRCEHQLPSCPTQGICHLV